MTKELIEKCPDGQTCGCITTGCWGVCARLQDPTTFVARNAIRLLARCPDCPPDYEALYHELLFAVGNKYSNESRHETALRYIRNAERPERYTGSTTTTAADGRDEG